MIFVEILIDDIGGRCRHENVHFHGGIDHRTQFTSCIVQSIVSLRLIHGILHGLDGVVVLINKKEGWFLQVGIQTLDLGKMHLKGRGGVEHT